MSVTGASFEGDFGTILSSTLPSQNFLVIDGFVTVYGVKIF